MNEPMRVHVTLDDDNTIDLTRVMAMMPGKDGAGRPVAVTPTDAIRFALRYTAKKGGK